LARGVITSRCPVERHPKGRCPLVLSMADIIRATSRPLCIPSSLQWHGRASGRTLRSTLTIDVWRRAAFRMGQQGTYCSKLAVHKR
jgi:hypothetical protein